ncbi:MAG: FAD-dependent oxidoreductase [Armatimonadetes bacterium]|nr:FAD-dependent oxidoreductase [Armatimonadota bacterium]
MNVAIVGAGIMGLCTARELLKRGHQVTLFEQIRPGNTQGSSHGRSRIVRQAYPDQFYTEILLEGHEMWHDLEKDLGRKLIHEVGLLSIGRHDSSEIVHELDTLDNLNVPHRVLTDVDIKTVCPQMALKHDEIAVMTLSAGWADVPAVLEGLLKAVQDRGADYVEGKVTDLRALNGFDRVVLTTGAWVTKFLDLDLRVTLQTVVYLDFETQGPVWIDYSDPMLYGFPSEPDASTTKIGFHPPGPETDPEDVERIPQEDAMALMIDRARSRFPRAACTATVVEALGCLYTVSTNEDFRLGWVDRRVLFASPCSGHGFKFGPWIGRLIAQVTLGEETLDRWPRFAP